MVFKRSEAVVMGKGGMLPMVDWGKREYGVGTWPERKYNGT